jgi:outer membrane protein assembly factor BamD (BamD/ComL family)
VGLLDVGFRRLGQGYATDNKVLASLEADYDAALEELGKNERTVPLMRNYAHLLAYSGSRSVTERLQRAADLLQDIIEMPRIKPAILAEVKLELGDLLLFAGEVWDASLLYSQVEKANKNDLIGAMAKFKNAKLSYYNNDFLWAKSQLDVLRASTSKLVANDAMQLSLLISDNMEEDSTFDMLELYAAADLMLYQGKLDSAWTLLDDITHRTLDHPLFDEILVQKARIRMRQGRYAEADSLLQYVVDHYGTDILADDALFMLAELNEQQLNNAQKAQECYEKLVIDYPASLFVDRARKKLKRSTSVP